MNTWLINGNALDIPLADKSVHMCVTSPPYWSLRDYGTATWEGGDAECEHKVREDPHIESSGLAGGKATTGHQREGYKNVCRRCGAVRVDNQLSLEKLHDCLGWATGSPCGECFICHVVAWAREVKRVLRDDGTFWCNLGDSFFGNSNSGGDTPRVGGGKPYRVEGLKRKHAPGLKRKDMCLIPARVALALQADGWWVRSDIIWSKPNPMPESVTDRPTKAHEYLWLLSKSEKYFYDQEAVREAIKPESLERERYGWNGAFLGRHQGSPTEKRPFSDDHDGFTNPAGRNRRSVWTIATAPYSGAHFATFPPALVEPCIKAGTSERGCCPTCGAQWVRVVEKGFNAHDGTTYSKYPDGWDTESGAHGTVHRKGRSNGTAAKRLALLRQAARESGNEYVSTSTTLGFRPSCSCPPHDPIPCVILDPFAGSGTTLLVARKLGRSAVGLDLSFDYLHDQARARLSLDALDEWENGGAEGSKDDFSGLPMFGRTD